MFVNNDWWSQPMRMTPQATEKSQTRHQRAKRTRESRHEAELSGQTLHNSITANCTIAVSEAIQGKE